jgi:hypothetical protein
VEKLKQNNDSKVAHFNAFNHLIHQKNSGRLNYLKITLDLLFITADVKLKLSSVALNEDYALNEKFNPITGCKKADFSAKV